MSAIKIYCNLRPEPGKPAFVQSATSAAGFVFSQFMRDMQVPLQIYGLLPNPTGGRVAPFTAQDLSAYDFWVGVGGYHTPLTTGTFVWNAGGYFEGVLDFKTTEMRAALGAATSATVINKIFEARFSKGSTEDIILQQAVRIGNVVKDEDAGDASSVSDTIFAERMEAALTDTNSIAWTRDTTHIYGNVRRKTAGGISEDSDGLFISAPMPTLNVSATAVMGFTASPTVDTDVATVQGPPGTRYRLKIGVAASVELSAYTGGTNHTGDDSHFLRGGTPPANNYNRLTLQVSSPAQTYVLNKGSSTIIETLAYSADIDADVGATLTLKLDSVDGLMLSPTQNCTVTLERVAVLPIDTTQADALLGITGTVQTRLNTLEAKRLDQWGAPQDNTDTNVSTDAHGLAPKLSGDSTQYLDGTGSYTTPPGQGALTLSTTVARSQNYDVLHKRAEGVMTARTTGTTPTVLASTLSLWSAFPDTNPNSVYPSGVLYFEAEVVAHRSGAGTLERAVWKLSGVAEIDTESISFPDAITKDLVSNSFTGGTPDAEFYTNGVSQIGIRATGLNDGSTKFTVWTAHVSLLLSAADKSIVI